MLVGHAFGVCLDFNGALILMPVMRRLLTRLRLRTHTHLGHPDFPVVLQDIASKHATGPVNVFFCGPPGLSRKLREICRQLHLPFREERF
jgi:predicted ferric reductase